MTYQTERSTLITNNIKVINHNGIPFNAVAPMEKPSKATNTRGCMKGKMWMADDFDAPLEDFKEYME